jgi:hypothetical protein
MNTTNTHLTILYDKNNWIFTGTYDTCHNEFVPVICYGYRKEGKENFVYVCEDHLDTITCKKQVCNWCNKKSVIKGQPRICQDCASLIIDNCIEMMKICQFPVASRLECKCKFCLMYR